MAAIALERVGKTYAGGVVAVEDVNLQMTDGELVVIVGPSGSGKSTLLRLIAGLESPTSGRILVGERDVTQVPPHARDLAMVFQSYALYPHKTVRENLAFGLRMRGVERRVIDDRIRRVAESLQIVELLDRKPGQLSGGQRQRVAVGRAIAREPRAFLFDEPLSNLDPALRLETRAELLRLHRRLATTIVYVTHDQEEAMTLGQRLIIMRDGRVQQVGAPQDVFRRPESLFVARFIGSPPMNLFPATVLAEDDRRIASGSGFTVPMDGHANAAPGAAVTLGIRPHDVTVVAGEDSDAEARVDVIERLGSELRVHLQLESAPLVVVMPADARVAVDDRVCVRFRRERLHVFDAESGKRVG